ncbi:AAA family ATPase [Mucilaginibacter agri]|uniref:AAA family ATPase n=1 Tax=Mucilaginibacter agri TaxID=2695265 RepID=A0A966DWF9_9SPHI|nr:AAA family ATPase [Mucilaginibacter agri]NCD72472.1 AAA family ATPase [Mucilaginibacter agri]
METNRESRITQIIPGYLLLEKLSDSNKHTVYRAIRETDGQEMVVKTLIDKYPQKEDIASIRREYQILSKIQFTGIIKTDSLVACGQGNWGIVMEKFGIPLDEYLTGFDNATLSLKQFLPIAIKLVSILGMLHEKKIIHNDISPANILIDADTGDLRLIDFSSSTELSRESQDIKSARRIQAALPYMSPEQTGRMNRDIDYRTDYYALGITFYQMLTGQFPFNANDALEWVHCHISKQPMPPNKLNKAIPEIVSDIILKLISKNAENRYQSSYGLVVDLEKCRDQLTEGLHDFSFELGESDVSPRFQIPQKLYGRPKEIERLELFFDNASLGSVEFCLVSGHSGVGKSVLVHELGKSIAKKRGYLIHGKFEQFKQNIAYVALARAFSNLIFELLAEPKQSLDNWSIEIKEALGTNAQLIIDLIPELELIIGEQPSVPELTPAEAQNRFLMLFINFVKIFARENHPLVIFMDDVQWADIPTLNLIHRLVTTEGLGYLLMICAYRDNAVDATHPLMLTLGEIQGKRFVENLHLDSLNLDAVNQIVTDSLLRDEPCSKQLSQVIFEKTAGNPFFTIELLKNLTDREIIYFNSANRKWDWDIENIKAVENSDNVIDFLVAKQYRLNKATQEVLQLAACIGATFDLKTLSIINESTPEETAADLTDALQSNMIIPLNESYKFVGLDTAFESVPNIVSDEKKTDGLNPTYRFQHDRVQQAAYSLIPSEKGQHLHLSIGRLILSHTGAAELDDVLMEVIGHLSKGRALITDEVERREFAQLSLMAGKKAKQSSAYQSALDLLKVGYEMLNDDAWQNAYDLIWKLSEEIQHCFYLTADWNEADNWTESMLKHAKTPIEKGLVLSARARQYGTIGKMRESIQAACEGLSVLGFDFLQSPTAEDVSNEVRLVSENLKGRKIADLINNPPMVDPKAKIASQLLMEVFPAAFLSASGEMFPYLVLKSVNIAFVYGNSPETAFAYTAYGMLLCGFYDNTALGYEYGKLGVSILEIFEDIALKSRIIYVYTMFIHHWSNHWSTMTPWFRKAIEAGYQSGDLLYLAYSAQDCIIWDPQLDLETASAEQRKLLKIVKECEYQDSYDSGTLFLQMQLNFQGLTESKYSLTDDIFDETECVQGMLQRHFMTGIANFHIYKAEIHFFYDDAAGALYHIQEQEKLTLSVMSLPQGVRFHHISFLVYAALLPNSAKKEQQVMLGKMNVNLAKITKWSKQCPENFEHLRLLMEAELSNFLSNGTAETLSLYEQAINAAKASKFTRDEAMANELAAKYLARIGFIKATEGYLQASRYLYYRWGAYRKVEEMDNSYPMLSGSTNYVKYPLPHLQKTEQASRKRNTDTFDSGLLDMSSVFKASGMISGELVLDKLLKATLQILTENAGAQKGYLFGDNEGRIVILGRDQDPHENLPGEESSALPLSLVNTALRTGEAIVIDNASEINPFSSDPYITRERPLSIMCVPLPLHNQWKAAVYLENNLTHGAFTEDRVQIIKLLAGQAAISIANARIYEDQEKLLKAQRRFVPIQFLKNLGHNDIAKVELGECVTMEMSVLFSDIREFTPLVELLSPREVIELLNQYYSMLGVPISESGGFIDSYAGDEIMALFAVSAQRAVEAGIKMTHALRGFNRDRALKAQPPLKMGIGMNTGPLVLGTMGGIDRMQCSVLGDTVNLASRIEHLNRVYDSQFLIGESTYLSLSNPAALSIRMVDYVAVKGKAIAIKLYEVLDCEEDERRAAKEATRHVLSGGMDAYFNRDFSTALTIFTEASELDPKDPVLSMFASRCKRNLANSIPEEWQGYETLVNK